MNLLLRGGRLVGAGADAVVADVLVEHGRIAAIGSDLDTSGVEVVDLDGRTIGAGTWDHHVHLAQWALLRQRADLTGVGSAADAAGAVARFVAARAPEPGSTVVGYGFRDALWPDEPTAAALDAAVPGHPVVLVSGDIHCVWLNTAALRRFGLDPAGPAVVREAPAFAINTEVSAVDEHTLDRFVHEAAQGAAARGVVGVVDLEMADNIAAWARRAGSGTRALRVRCGVYADRLDAAVRDGWRTGDVVPGTGGLVTVGPFKVITDGSLNTRTAYCHDPYPGPEGMQHGAGTTAFAPEELVALLRRAVDGGFEPAVHAIGDRANTVALDALAAVGGGGGIEHAQLVARSDVPRFAALGVTASVQPEHAMDDRDVADRLWAGRTDRAFAFESLLASGARLRLGSDAPVAPLDPWVSMAAAVSRRRDGREPWHPEQRIAQAAAYAASVADPVLRVGDPADLAITELDPLTATDEELRRMPVAGTLLAGEWTHRAF